MAVVQVRGEGTESEAGGSLKRLTGQRVVREFQWEEKERRKNSGILRN